MYPLIVSALITVICFVVAVYYACETFLEFRVRNLAIAVLMMVTSLSGLTYIFQRYAYG